MAAKSKGKRKTRKKEMSARRSMIVFALVCAAILLSFGVLRFNAIFTHVRPAVVYLSDLPAAFDGTTLLYISDLNIRGATDAASCERLMRKLSALSPDLLVLGGDYSSGNLIDVLNQSRGDGSTHAVDFIKSLANFHTTYGKFAVLGEMDYASELAPAFTMANVQLLQDSGAFIERDGAKLSLVGLKDVSASATNYAAIARNFRSNECVLVLAHNPLAYTRIRMAEGKGGGTWADLVLSGHTLGGQIRLFGRTLRPFTEEESRRVAGWYYSDDLPTLVSQGLGCRDVKLRLGTSSEVWFLTLRRPEWRDVES